MENTPPSLATLHQYRRFKVDLSAFYQNKKVRTYASVVLTIGTVAFFLLFAIRPTIITIAKLTREIKDNKTVIDGLDRKIESLNSAQIEYQRIKNQLSLIDEALPLEPDLGLLVRQLEALARKDSVSLVSLQFSPSILVEAAPEKNGGVTNLDGKTSELGFSLSATGDYDRLTSFAKKLTELRRIVKIEAYALDKDKSEKMTLVLKAQAYYLLNK